MTSLCMSLHCHICCFQGNPVGKLRSAERYTAWRRETCGAQPVDGKKPVRDSPTNPVAFPCLWETSFSSLGVTARLTFFSTKRWGQGSQCCFLWASRGKGLPYLFSVSKHNENIKTKHKEKKITLSRSGDFLRLRHFHLQLNKENKTNWMLIRFFYFPLASNQNNVWRVQISFLLYPVVHCKSTM